MTVPRVGFGFDAHQMAPSHGDAAAVILGGIVAATDRTVLATSDGDVVAHALCDALLGAAALGDLGELFPSSDPRWQDADSMELLADVVKRVARAGFAATSVDVTVLAQTVRVAPIRDEIRARLADVLELTTDAVSVKATTTDEMGYLGRDEGIAATAVAVIVAT